MKVSELPALKDALVMLDLDGTLIEFADTPDSVIVPDDLVAKLARLAELSRGVALISGRAVADVAGLLPDFAGDIFGSHGSEYRIDGTMGTDVDVPDTTVKAIWQGADEIARDCGAEILTERKPAGVVVHYRRAPEWADTLVAKMTDLAARHPAFEVHGSNMATELRATGFTKGDAARHVIARAPKGSIPVFAGDDTTDEDAMHEVNTQGGVSIKVGPGPTCARARVRDVSAMHALLSEWIER